MNLRRARFSAAALAAIVTAGACGDATGPSRSRDFTLSARNLITQVGTESTYVPEFRVTAGSEVSDGEVQEIQGIAVSWPDGSTRTTADAEFDQISGGWVATVVDEAHPEELTPGDYRLELTYDVNDKVFITAPLQIPGLLPVTGLSTTADALEVTLAWTAPPQAHTWRTELYRVVEQPGPDLLEYVDDGPTGQSDGASGQFNISFSLTDIEAGKGFVVKLILENATNVRTVEATGTRPE